MLNLRARVKNKNGRSWYSMAEQPVAEKQVKNVPRKKQKKFHIVNKEAYERVNFLYQVEYEARRSRVLQRMGRFLVP